jgi:hypothetical protein
MIKASDVRDATNIDDDAMMIGMFKNSMMKRRNQWRSLPARRNIAASEIRNNGNLRQFRQQSGVDELDGVIFTGFGAMPDRLAMTTDSSNLPRRDTGIFQHSRSGLCIQGRQLVTENSRAIQFILTGLMQR